MALEWVPVPVPVLVLVSEREPASVQASAWAAGPAWWPAVPA
ncbi:hypothetical protein [Pseudosporangium ferrugineum]|nr:hypothetical protein [Pseudosporangium ferrugineum]